MGSTYVPADDIVKMFGFLAGKKVEFDTEDLHTFCFEVNKEIPGIFRYNYITSEIYPYSDSVKSGLDRIMGSYSEWELNTNKIRIKDSCKNALSENLFSKDKLKELEEVADLFYWQFKSAA